MKPEFFLVLAELAAKLMKNEAELLERAPSAAAVFMRGRAEAFDVFVEELRGLDHVDGLSS